MSGGELIGAPSALPAGRHIALTGRGRTFVRELPGPAGAPTLVLLHGWTATADLNWHACFGPLGEHFRVVALDHRGHGRGLRSQAPFRLADCADDVAALVGELHLGRVIPVGYSMGGPIAQLLWQRHPELVAGMVLCATSCTFTGTIRERILFGVAAGTSVVAAAVPVGRVAGAALHTWNSLQHRRGSAWWGFDEVARHDWTNVIEAGCELGRFDSRRWIGQVDVPTAVVVTDHDDVVPTSRQRDLIDRLHRPIVHRVPGGHTVCTLDPSRFVPVLVDACRGVVGDGRRGKPAVAAA